MTLLAVPAVLVVVVLARPLLAGALRDRGATAAFPVVAAGPLLCAAATELFGLHSIFGAFLFGTVCPRGDGGLRAEVVDRLSSVGRHLLLPCCRGE